jgi:hypothetical protein
VAGVVSQLVDCQLVLRCGVNKTHLVHGEFYRPWVIHSYRLARLERESIPEVPAGMILNVGEDVVEEDQPQSEYWVTTLNTWAQFLARSQTPTYLKGQAIDWSWL